MQARQFEFQVQSLNTGARDQVRVTAMSEETARAAVLDAYGTAFQISQQAIAVRPAHQVFGEINCL